MEAQVQEMARQIQILTQQLQQVQEERRQEAARAATATPTIQILETLLARQTQALEGIATSRLARPTLVDVKGLGKPPQFAGQPHEAFPVWSLKVQNFLAGVHHELAALLEWAAEQQDPITKEVLDRNFGQGGLSQTATDIHQLNTQVYTVLVQLLDKEPFDMTVNAREAGGLEAWRRIVRRFDPTTAARKRNLLATILKQPRVKLDELSAALEKLDELILKYEQRKDAAGNRTELGDEIKIAIVETVVPQNVEHHLQMNKSRLTTYRQVRDEVALYVETRHSISIKERQSHHGGATQGDDPMEIGSLGAKGKGKGKPGKGPTKGKKGGGKGKSPTQQGKQQWSQQSPHKQQASQFQGYCDNCGKWGHKKAQCWSSGGGQANPKKGGKGVGRAVGSLDGNEVQEKSANEIGTLELCALSAGGGDETNRRTRMKCNLDTGAAVTAIPEFVAKNLERTAATQDSYRTASGEVVQDAGGVRLVGRTCHGNKVALNGRVVPVHKVLISASKVVRAGHCVWLADGGGVIAPRLSSTTKKKISEVIKKEARGAITQVYEHKGTYVFDLDIDNGCSPSDENDCAMLAPLSSTGGASSSSFSGGCGQDSSP